MTCSRQRTCRFEYARAYHIMCSHQTCVGTQTPVHSPSICSMPRMPPGAGMPPGAWGSRAPANAPLTAAMGQMSVRHPLQSIWPRFQAGRTLPTVDTTPRTAAVDRPSWQQQQTPSIMKRTRRSSSNSIQMVCEQRTRRSSTNSMKMACEHDDFRQQRTRRSSTNSMLGSSTNSILGSPANSILGKMDCEHEDVEDASLLLYLGNKKGSTRPESPLRKKVKMIC